MGESKLSQFSKLIGTSSDAIDAEVLEHLLADKRSDNTRRAYARDIKDFFLFAVGVEPNSQLILDFLGLEQFQAVVIVLKYKAHLLNKGLKEATVNRSISAIKSLTKMGRKLGKCSFTLEDVDFEEVKAYRDTSGIGAEEYAKVLELVDKSTVKGKRDYAILRLLWDNALRRDEVCKLNVGDFNASKCTISILGKGRGTSKEVVQLSSKTTQAIVDWLKISKRTRCKVGEPLFIALAINYYGHRLSGESIRKLVDKTCKAAGITKKMSPHRVRHSSITKATEVYKGDYQKIQKLSRHANLDTVKRYDDNRKNREHQAEVTNTLADLI